MIQQAQHRRKRFSFQKRVSIVPRPPPFLHPFAFKIIHAWKWNSDKNRKALVSSVTNDVRWMQGRRGKKGTHLKNKALFYPFEHSTTDQDVSVIETIHLNS